MPRLTPSLLAVLFVTWLAAVGVVVGFCLGGLLGPRLFGDLGGHGLGNLGHLFRGAAFGAAAGVIVGIYGSINWTPPRRGRAAKWAGLAGLVVAGITTLLVNSFGGW